MHFVRKPKGGVDLFRRRSYDTLSKFRSRKITLLPPPFPWIHSQPVNTTLSYTSYHHHHVVNLASMNEKGRKRQSPHPPPSIAQPTHPPIHQSHTTLYIVFLSPTTLQKPPSIPIGRKGERKEDYVNQQQPATDQQSPGSKSSTMDPVSSSPLSFPLEHPTQKSISRKKERKEKTNSPTIVNYGVDHQRSHLVGS